MQKVIAAVVIGAVFAAGVLYSRSSAEAPRVTVHVTQTSHSDVPSPVEAPTPAAYTLPETTIVATPRKAARRWSCGEPRALQNDAVQTVRHCEWI